MGLFEKKAQNFLGVDIGTSGIKLVQLSNEKGRARLVTYGMAEIGADVIRNKTAENINIIATKLASLVQKSRVSTKDCSAALPIFSVFNSVISLPEMSKSDMDSAVRWEAKKFVPFPIEEMILDWKTIIKPDKSNQITHNDKLYTNGEIDKTRDFIKTKSKFTKVLLTAAPKSLVSIYIDIFKKSQLNLLSLEVESFATARALIDQNTNNVMIIDIGSVTTDVCVVEKAAKQEGRNMTMVLAPKKA